MTDKPEINAEMDPEFQNALDRNQKAKSCFDQLSPSHQKRYLLWIQMAKRQETRDRRIRELITLLEQGKTLGLK
ncbi:MAG: YdeI/OmpD-associated family protein [Candidatus Marinimicrobia bacterium]|nr:YdeI/OmpD-associated family protein [Candidatus Neomarinimicrobiota bacterium]